MDFIYSHDKNKDKIKKRWLQQYTFSSIKTKNLRSPVFVKYGPTKYKLDEELHQLSSIYFIQISTRAWSTRAHQARVPSWVNKISQRADAALHLACTWWARTSQRQVSVNFLFWLRKKCVEVNVFLFCLYFLSWE